MLNNLLERKECWGLLPVLRALSMDMSSKSILGRNQLYLLWECMEHRSTLILRMLCSLIWKSIITGGDNSYERIYGNNICFGSCFHFFAFCKFISFESLFDHDGFIFLCVFHFNELERFHFMIHGDKDSWIWHKVWSSCHRVYFPMF